MNQTEAVTMNDQGWEYQGRTYRSLVDVDQVIHQPTLTIPHNTFSSLVKEPGCPFPAATVLTELADLLTNMIRPTSEIIVEHTFDGVEKLVLDEAADRVNACLRVCIVRLREDAAAVKAPAPIDGGF